MESDKTEINCNTCICINKWSKDDTLFKCVEFDVALNRHQILRDRMCNRYIEAMKKLIDV